MLDKNNLFVTKVNSKRSCGLLRRFADVWRGHNLKHVDQNTLGALRLRTWIFHIGTTVFHIAQIFSESGSYFEIPIICDETKDITKDCIDGYNEDFMQALRPITDVLMRILVFSSTFACIACYKWRFIADYFILYIHLMVFIGALHLNMGMKETTQTDICIFFLAL